jgi:CheY-like chemotaxis protein
MTPLVLSCHPLTVLVVDNSRDTADSLGYLLSLYGYQTRVTYGGEVALRLASAEPTDAVVLDLAMPGIDGWELTRRLRDMWRWKRPLLIAVSGYGDRAARRSRGAEALRAGPRSRPTGPLPKPRHIRRVLHPGWEIGRLDDVRANPLGQTGDRPPRTFAQHLAGGVIHSATLARRSPRPEPFRAFSIHGRRAGSPVPLPRAIRMLCPPLHRRLG